MSLQRPGGARLTDQAPTTSSRVHSVAGRSPWPTWLGQFPLHQRQVVGVGDPDASSGRRQHGERGCVEGLRPRLRGASTSASSEASVAAAMAACNVLWKAGVKPQRFIDTRASGESSDGFLPSAEANRPVAAGGDLAPFVDPSNCPSGPTSQMPRVTGAVPTTASARRKPTRALVGSSASGARPAGRRRPARRCRRRSPRRRGCRRRGPTRSGRR